QAAAPTVDINRTKLDGGYTYKQGETSDKFLYTKGESVETGAVISYEWFRSTNEDGTDAVSVGEGKVQWVGTSQIGNVNCLYPPTDLPGTYYYYCEITSTITLPDGKISSSTTKTAVSGAWVVEEIQTQLAGSGTETDPYLISTAADMDTLMTDVNSGTSFDGTYIKVMDNITLNTGWTGIGSLKEGADTAAGSTVNAFAGTFDGNGKTITIPSGHPGLFNYSMDSTVKNLKIKGENITGSAVLNKAFVDYGPDDVYDLSDEVDCIYLENVTLLGGSATTGPGMILGSGSGINNVILVNCVVEDNVKVQNASFVEYLNGMIISCSSAADVYGENGVGGLVGHKGQTMGSCTIANSSFTGTVNASGNWAGGIIGRGYSDAVDGGLNPNTTAPNTPVVSIRNCMVSGTVNGNDYVGGIFGGEPVVEDCWANGVGSVTDNLFCGTINAKGENAGAVIGYLNSMNENQSGSGNYYVDSCGVQAGVGKINGASADLDMSTVAVSKTATEMADGTVKDLLNSSETSMRNWLQGETHPVLNTEKVAYSLEISGTYKTDYTIGEELDLSGMTFTAIWSDGSVSYPSAEDVTVIGFDNTQQAVLTLTATYGAAKDQFTVKVLKPVSGDSGNTDIRVSFTLLGDSIHSDEKGNLVGTKHTLVNNNLTVWIPKTTYTVDVNATVYDVLKESLKENGMTYSEDFSSGTAYIESITRNGMELGEFDNGNLSGWMYTLNGKHPILGVAEQFLTNGDVIVFHYTDDYTVEEGSEDFGGAAYNPETTLPEDAPTVTLTDEAGAAATDGGKVTYDSESKTLTIAANEGYEIKDVKVNGVS
ncbi:MAG: DUF4430 domain-containing protein, partial [Firmicutes bacterium]|nr:DUF4430 domain-containing protein [Bacillota bacterium]